MVSRYLPAMQLMQVAAWDAPVVVVEYLPAAHRVQSEEEVLPVALEYEPA